MKFSIYQQHCCLIGSTGLVGSNLLAKTNFSAAVHSTNIQTLSGESFEIIICAGAPGTKWIANKDPKEDLSKIKSLLSSLSKIRTKTFILISTIDVYPNISSKNDESLKITELPDHAYGQHRRWLETEVQNIFPNSVIVRLPGLYGLNLKKNLIFDLINAHFLEQMNLRSAYQWYNLSRLHSDLETIFENDIKIINLFPEPISNEEIILQVFSDKYHLKNDSLYVQEKNLSSKIIKLKKNKENICRYDLRTKYGDIFGNTNNEPYIFSKEEVIKDLKKYVSNSKGVV